MTFEEVDRRFQELQQQFQAGTLSAEAFDNALKDLMVQDQQGNWWAKSRSTGAWNVYNQATGQWSEAAPPYAKAPEPIPAYQPPVQTYQPPVQTYQPPVQPVQPTGGALSQGTAILIYVGSFFIPLLGIILFFVFKDKPAESDRKVGKNALIIGIISIVLSILCSCLYFFVAMSGSYY